MHESESKKKQGLPEFHGGEDKSFLYVHGLRNHAGMYDSYFRNVPEMYFIPMARDA